jgi:Arc/MetJ-type ribon-helix-helix transcriptional regulator
MISLMMKRVTVTLPEELIAEIDRWDTNRSRFVLEAAQHELDARRREQLERSLLHPHDDSWIVAEMGFDDWGRVPEDDDEALVDEEAGRSVRWTPEVGWTEDSE